MRTHVDLCSGIGGFALGFEWAGLSRPAMFCDIDPWCRKLIRKHWPDTPVATDVKELSNDPERLVPDCDILTAGYPCQPFSFAGARKGEDDDRHIWPFISKIITRKRPTWCVLENVYGHISMGLDKVCLDLEAADYAARPFVVPAIGLDAPHRRDRVFIIARNMGDTSGGGCTGNDGRGSVSQSSGRCEDVADPAGIGLEQHGHGQAEIAGIGGEAVPDTDGTGLERPGQEHELREGERETSSRRSSGWAVEPAVRRVAYGVPNRVDRIRGLGNAIVPQIAERIGLTIRMIEEQ